MSQLHPSSGSIPFYHIFDALPIRPSENIMVIYAGAVFVITSQELHEPYTALAWNSAMYPYHKYLAPEHAGPTRPVKSCTRDALAHQL